MWAWVLMIVMSVAAIAIVALRRVRTRRLIPESTFTVTISERQLTISAALIFPGGATGEAEAIRAFQVHLAGFRNDEVAAAMRSTANREFVVWEREL